MEIEQLFFDLDDTLYPSGNGIWHQISARITQYMIDRVGLSRRQAEERRRHYARQFGTSLTGLMADYQVDPAEYLEFVHDISLEPFITPEPELAGMLATLPQAKAVFTNASRQHARNVLAKLEISEHFETIIAIEDTNYINKPELRAYSHALTKTKRRNGEGCLLVEDRIENLKPAADLGMVTVLVSRQHHPADFIDFQIQEVLDLTRVVPELVEGSEPKHEFS